MGANAGEAWKDMTFLPPGRGALDLDPDEFRRLLDSDIEEQPESAEDSDDG